MDKEIELEMDMEMDIDMEMKREIELEMDMNKDMDMVEDKVAEIRWLDKQIELVEMHIPDFVAVEVTLGRLY